MHPAILDIDPKHIGELSGSKKEFGAAILITTWQSLNNDATLQTIIDDKYSMVICDEMHKCKKRMNLATNNGNTWSDKTVLFGH